MSSFVSAFVGVPQSRYAAFAVLLAIVVVSLSVLLGNSPIPASQKFGFLVLIFLTSLPSLALTLFQLTCLVTGAVKNWWCSAYAWVLCAIAIFYAGMLIVAAVISSRKEGFVVKHNNLSGKLDTTKIAKGYAANKNQQKPK